MASERQRIEAAPPPTVETPPPPPPPYEEVNINNTSTAPMQNGSNYEVDYFIGEVIIFLMSFLYLITKSFLTNELTYILFLLLNRF